MDSFKRPAMKSLETFTVMVYNTTCPPELFGQVATYRHNQASGKDIYRSQIDFQNSRITSGIETRPTRNIGIM